MKIKHIFIGILMLFSCISCDMSNDRENKGDDENNEQIHDSTDNDKRRRFYDEKPDNRGQSEDPLDISNLIQ